MLIYWNANAYVVRENLGTPVLDITKSQAPAHGWVYFHAWQNPVRLVIYWSN